MLVAAGSLGIIVGILLTIGGRTLMEKGTGVLVVIFFIGLTLYFWQGYNEVKHQAMSDRIDASPEEIAQRVLRQPKKDKWRYEEDNDG